MKRTGIVLALLLAGSLLVMKFGLAPIDDKGGPTTFDKHGAQPTQSTDQGVSPGEVPVRTPVGSQEQRLRSDIRLRFQVAGDVVGPVEGVRLMLAFGSSVWRATTDMDGECIVTLPADSGRGLLTAECDRGFLVGVPQVVEAREGHHRLTHVDEIVLEGQARDSTGVGVAAASVFLVSPRAIERTAPWPEARLLCQTDGAGLFRCIIRDAWPSGSCLVATKAPLVPACWRWESLGVPVPFIALDLQHGVQWMVSVTNEAGGPVEGCRVLATTISSPVLDGWVADEVPAGAGSELGLVSRSAVTNRLGVAVVEGWPAGRGARLRVLAPRGRKHRVTDSDLGRMMDLNTISVTPVEGAVVRVCAVEVAAEQLIARGRVVGFSGDEMSRLSLLRVGDNGGNERVQPSIGTDGRFEARFSLGTHEDQAAIRLRLVAEILDARWRSELGTYELGRGREVDGIVVSK